MKIVYLKHHEINKFKWDKCISNAFNGIIYAYSWYLDVVCPEWEALIQGDYYRVMPLTPAVKYNISYIYQPMFTQQLGVFSTMKLSPDIINDFLASIPKKYKFIELNLNTFNQTENSEFEIRENNTYQLDLINPYEKITQKYSSNTKRNLKKAKTNKVNIFYTLPPNELVKLYQSNLGERLKEIKERDYQNLRKIIDLSIHHRFGQIYTAYTEHNNLCAAALFITSHSKTIYYLAVSTDEGKENRAMFLLIDRFIQKHAERNLTLDFEGSNVPGLARFYKGFGASEAKYPSVKKNNLPWYIKMFKN